MVKTKKYLAEQDNKIENEIIKINKNNTKKIKAHSCENIQKNINDNKNKNIINICVQSNTENLKNNNYINFSSPKNIFMNKSDDEL